MSKLISLTQNQKTCPICKQNKIISEFNICKYNKDGFQRMCRICQSNYRKSRREYNNKYNKEYNLLYPEKRLKASKEYRERNYEKVCKSARDYARRIRKEKPEECHKKDRKVALLKYYGITENEYNNLYKKQNGVCAICGGKQRKNNKYFCIDHDHKTKKVRGLLCHNCNVALGLINENKEILKKMIEYL